MNVLAFSHFHTFYVGGHRGIGVFGPTTLQRLQLQLRGVAGGRNINNFPGMVPLRNIDIPSVVFIKESLQFTSAGKNGSFQPFE
jgi:hypothetical protein